MALPLAASPSPPLPNFKIPILSLPQEVLRRVLELAVEEEDREKSNEILRACSLVCPTWRTEACAQLWHDVEIRTESVAQLILGGRSFGKYHTHKLYIIGGLTSDGVVGHTAAKVVTGLKGIQEVKLEAFHEGDQELGLDMFCNESLASTFPPFLSRQSYISESSNPFYRSPFIGVTRLLSTTFKNTSIQTIL